MGPASKVERPDAEKPGRVSGGPQKRGSALTRRSHPDGKASKRRKSWLASFTVFKGKSRNTAKPPKPKRIDVLFKGEATAAATSPAQPASSQTAAAETLLGSKLLFDLLLVRPWILVCGFWLLLVGTSAVALSGLADPGKPTVSDPTNGEVQPMQPLGVAPDTAVTSRLSASPVALNGGQTTSSTTEPLPMWSLWVMVGACAAGCIMLSRPGLITFGGPERRRPSRRQGGKLARSPQPPGRTSGAAKTAGPARPQLKPQYPQGQVMTVSHQGGIHQVTPTPTVKPPGMVSFEVSQPNVSVVPAHESNALDWEEGSLAHKLDVRQNRSLKSFL